MSRRLTYHVWTSDELNKLRYHYSAGGSSAAREALPHLTLQQIISRARKLGVKAPNFGKYRREETYRNLTPLDPDTTPETEWDNPRVVHRPVGQWKAAIPAVRSVFDLGVAK